MIDGRRVRAQLCLLLVSLVVGAPGAGLMASTPPGPGQHEARCDQVVHLRVPAGGGQQPLHVVGGALAGVLGQLPAVLAAHVAKESLEVGQRPLARLGASEPSRDPGVQGVQPGRPRPDLFEVCRLVGLQHRLLLPFMSSAPSRRRPTTSSRCGCASSSRLALTVTGPSRAGCCSMTCGIRMRPGCWRCGCP
jgi:hypothetical protein